MRVRAFIVAAGAQLIFCLSTVAAGQEQQTAPPELDNDDVVATLVGRLELEQFKGTLEGLTQFGDRAQGTQRNRDAVDWIEARLQAVGCTSTGRVSYEMPPRPVRERSPDRPRAGGPDNRTEGTATGGRIGRNGTGPGGSVVFGYRSRQYRPAGERAGIPTRWRIPMRCTSSERTWMAAAGVKPPTTTAPAPLSSWSWLASSMPPMSRPNGRSGSLFGTARRRGSTGAAPTSSNVRPCKATKTHRGSGQYPEPKWLAMIQHDMMLFDHGAPGPGGRVSRDQRPEADVNVEFQSTAELAAEAQELAWFFKAANEQYATDYPATVGPHMTNTDSSSFMNAVPAISLRENERGAQIGAGWDPHWHQPTDVFSTFTDDDFRLGLNAAQTTLAAISQLAGATIEP